MHALHAALRQRCHVISSAWVPQPKPVLMGCRCLGLATAWQDDYCLSCLLLPTYVQHYLPSLLATLGLEGECACEAWGGHAYQDWKGQRSHPCTFK